MPRAALFLPRALAIMERIIAINLTRFPSVVTLVVVIRRETVFHSRHD
jgi:hypothetical protein